MVDAREMLKQLAREREEDYASLSRMLGRNAAYIQQFIQRGVPRKLQEEDRRLLARYFGVDEALLGAPPKEEAQTTPNQDPLILVPQLAIGASAGPGTIAEEEAKRGKIGFDARWLRRLTGNSAALSMIQVRGDSMVPTLADGDDILVDRADAAERMRDGIYVMRLDDALLVKRLAVNPVTRRFDIRSDNPAYPDWPDCDPAQVNLIGRVIWIGRRLG